MSDRIKRLRRRLRRKFTMPKELRRDLYKEYLEMSAYSIIAPATTFYEGRNRIKRLKAYGHPVRQVHLEGKTKEEVKRQELEVLKKTNREARGNLGKVLDDLVEGDWKTAAVKSIARPASETIGEERVQPIVEPIIDEIREQEGVVVDRDREILDQAVDAIRKWKKK